MEMNVEEFDEIAREVFAPIYPVIAKQIKQRTGIKSGTCLDIGAGGGYLGIALAKITDLSICLFDKSDKMIKIAEENITKNAIRTRVKTQLGDVHNLPFKDQTINLVISRGSIFFWDDLPRAFTEIYRILMPGGVAYIGGGLGSNKLKEQISKTMKKSNKNWKIGATKNFGDDPIGTLNTQIRLAGIKDYGISKDESGLWVIIKRY